MEPTLHPTVAMELAHYRMQEEIERAEAYRTARQARAAQRAARRATQRAGRDSRAVAHSRGVSILAFLRGEAGRA